MAWNQEFLDRFDGQFPGFARLVAGFTDLELQEWNRLLYPYPAGNTAHPYDPESEGRYFCITNGPRFTTCGDNPADFAEGPFPGGLYSCPLPMGYTNLAVLERRAVVASGKVLRLWPEIPNQEAVFRVRNFYSKKFFVETMPYPKAEKETPVPGPVRFRHDFLGEFPSLDEALACAIQIRGCVPILIGRQLIDAYWH